jgi:hypothetical protein
MHCNAPQVEGATSSPVESTRSSKRFTLAILLALSGVTAGCGAASQLSPQSAGRIAVSVPAPEANVGVRYSAVPLVSGGIAPYTFTVEKGSLPPGVLLNPQTGSITGVPLSAGNYVFTLSVTDSARPDRATVAATIVVIPESSKGNPSPRITVSPSTTTVVSQETQQFSASITGTSNTVVAWSTTAGAISSNGTFTAPKVSSSTPVIITATSATDGSVRATATVNVTPASSGNPSPRITVSPNNATVVSQETQQFSASITGTSNTAVAWSTTAGAISSTGTFTAPKVSSSTPVTITATSATDGSLRATATVSVTPAPSLFITTSGLAEANVGMAYSTSLSASGGRSPYRWNLSAGSLPSGIELQNDGVLGGTPALSGSYTFTVNVTDSAATSSTHPFTLSVSSVSVSGFDGPAELPRAYLQTAMANTPASGTTIAVNAGGNLQSALNAASCGDTIQLQAGATFTGTFTFPAKTCDDNHWIVVRTNADDSALPAEGSRLTPCYAGVSSLPGRPAFHCTSTKNVLAKLVLPTTGSGPILFASGANHYRLMGLEITRIVGTGIVYALSSVVQGGTVNNLVFDRVWMHGTAQDETNRGVWLGGGTYISVVDSFLTDFHCIAGTGACVDSQAIAGGLGSGPMGPYKITGNFLEAAGENVIFGGGWATSTPADIQISQNHMFKPLTWMKGQPGYVGGADGNPFVVKNLFEVKNGQRILLDGNIMENSWGGFSQVGFAIVLTPKNQSGANGLHLCPVCQVTDVTVRNTTISHVGGGLQIANVLADNGGAALDGQRYSIHDIVIDDIDGNKFNGPGEFAEIAMSAGAPRLQNVHINHVTAFPPHTLFVVGDMVARTMPIKNFVFTNSIVSAGTAPVWSMGGGASNCAFFDVPLTTFNACFSGSAFAPNAIIGASSADAPAKWPSGNYFPGSNLEVQFLDYNGSTSGDYHLLSSSPYRNKGTDGKDLGADIDAVNSAVAGVE